MTMTCCRQQPVGPKRTLESHIADACEYIYTLAELEEGKMHDDLWNAAQL